MRSLETPYIVGVQGISCPELGSTSLLLDTLQRPSLAHATVVTTSKEQSFQPLAHDSFCGGEISPAQPFSEKSPGDRYFARFDSTLRNPTLLGPNITNTEPDTDNCSP